MMNKHYAVFIDDDELMLKAIKRTTKRLIPGWRRCFINNALKWQQYLHDDCVPDIIFCDYRMPGATGAMVLSQVAALYPNAIRVLVTGEASDEVLINCSSHAHSMILKPFTDQQLLALLNNVEQVKAQPFTRTQRLTLNQLSQLPVLPGVVDELNVAIESEQGNAKVLSAIVAKDPLIASRTLQLANSAYMGFQRKTLLLEEAISRLGTQLLHAVITTLAIEQATQQLMPVERHQRICDFTHRFACAARSVARRLGKPKQFQEHLFTCAILSGIGRLVLEGVRLTDHNTYRQLTKEAHYPDMLISAYLLLLWCYPDDIIASLMAFADKQCEDDATCNLLYYTQQYERIKHKPQLRGQFEQSLPPPIKNAFRQLND